jgi:GT2 family glycosyltransferase
VKHPGRCSVIIPVHNRASLTRQCLEALLGEPPLGLDWEIIVVDDASTDLTPSVLAGYGDRIRTVGLESNVGFAAACNRGAMIASGAYLLFLNNDTLPKPGWLDALARYAEAHPDGAAFGAKLLYPDGTIQHAGVVICQDRFPRHVYQGFPADHPAVNRSRRYQAVTGACLLVRAAAFFEVKGFDSQFVNGYEDHDLCLRLGERGYEVHYCHESVLYHLESASREGRADEAELATRLYLERWGERVRPDDLDYYVADGLLRLSYWESYPVQMEVSPLLAVVAGGGRDTEAEGLLATRARQVYELMKETLRLRVRADEAELRSGTDSGR